jgi:hypothetical protein
MLDLIGLMFGSKAVNLVELEIYENYGSPWPWRRPMAGHGSPPSMVVAKKPWPWRPVLFFVSFFFFLMNSIKLQIEWGPHE